MDLTKAKLPDAVEVSGKFYPIQTTHSFWFRFAEILEQKEIQFSDVDFLYTEEMPEDRQAGFDELVKFFYEKKDIPRGAGAGKILDYKIDSDYIYAGILQCYGVDLFDKQLHWHKVRAMLISLHGTKLNEIFTIRSWTDTKNKSMMRAKAAWALADKDDVSEEEIKAFKNSFKII